MFLKKDRKFERMSTCCGRKLEVAVALLAEVVVTAVAVIIAALLIAQLVTVEITLVPKEPGVTSSTIGGGKFDVFKAVSSLTIGSGKGSGVSNGDGSPSEGCRS